MTEPENFLQRWSRRKRAAPDPVAPETDAAPPQTADGSQPSPPQQNTAPQNQPFDPGSLPPLESIDATTDVTAFLRPGVPAELTRAALRRAWSSDPAIRDFVGLVESGWDFNDPQAMGGFGPISAGDVAKLASRAIGSLPSAAARVDKLPAEATPSEERGQAAISARADQPGTAADGTAAGPADVAAQRDSAG